MKTKYALMVVMAGMAFTAFGQDEVDDMYFNSKDRARQNAAQEVILAKQYKEEDARAKVMSPINPTDSYSGRAINPEYVNRLKTDPNQANNEPEYFVSNFQPKNVNKNLGNVNYGNSFYSPYYGSCPCNNPYSYYGANSPFLSPYSGMSPYYGMGLVSSPFYGSNFFGSPYSSGMSMMMGSTFGSAMYNPWFGGMSYGMSSMYSPFWNNYYAMNSFYPGYGYGYGNSAAYDTRNIVYHKRQSRSSELNNAVYNNRANSAIVDAHGRSRGAASGGRIADNSTSNYYHRGWRSNPDIISNNRSEAGSSGGSFWSGSQNNRNNNSWGTYNNTGRSSFGNSGLGGFSGGGRAGGLSSGGHSTGGARGRD